MKDLIISKNLIESKIVVLRGERVILDKDLSELYGVTTKRLNEQVKRNVVRFPNDFMFQLTKEEVWSSRSQIATLKRGANIKYLPHAFTEQGVAMLSSVLSSDRAVKVNISIMRIFVFMRKFAFSSEALEKRLLSLEKKHWQHDEKMKEVMETIKYLIRGNLNNKPKEIKGFEG